MAPNLETFRSGQTNVKPNPPAPGGPPPSHRPPSATPTSSEQPSKAGPRPPPWAGTTYKRTANVKALRDLTTPGKGLHEAIVDLVLWRARKHTQGQHVWIPPIEWGQALTHDTDINVTRRGTVRLRQAPAERDLPADPNRPEQWKQATAPTGDTALRAAGLRTPDDDLPPHLQTVTTLRRRSGVRFSSAGTTT